MPREYLCPECGGLLNPEAKIILRAERRGKRALFCFNPRPGNYDVVIPKGFRLKKGEAVKFACPICGHDLTSRHEADMAEIRFIGTGDREGVVVFSRQYGHHETYFITKEEVRSYGEHAPPEGVNFWGVGPSR